MQRGPAGSSSSASSDSPSRARPDAEALDSEVASPQLQRLNRHAPCRRGCGCARPPRAPSARVLLAVRERSSRSTAAQRRAELAEANSDRGRAPTPLRTAIESARGRSARERLHLRPRACPPAARSPSSDRAPPRAGWSPSRASRSTQASTSCRPDWPHRRVWRPNPLHPARRHAVRERQLADLDAPRAAGPVEPLVHLVGLAGRTVASWNGRSSPSSTTPSPRPRGCAPGQAGAGGVLALELQRQHLPEPCRPVALEHVAARLQLEPVERRLEAEATAVHRGGQRQNRPLQLLANVSVLLQREA